MEINVFARLIDVAGSDGRAANFIAPQGEKLSSLTSSMFCLLFNEIIYLVLIRRRAINYKVYTAPIRSPSFAVITIKTWLYCR